MQRTVKDFSRKELHDLAVRYANSDTEFSHSYYEKEFGVSKETFYNALKKAVVENIVDNATVKKMAKKAAYNSFCKAGTGGRKRSERYYEHLIQKRKIYMLPKKETVDLTTKYSESALTKEEFCMKNYITTSLFDRTLVKATADCWVSDEVFAALREKSLRKSNKPQVIAFWETLERFRNEKNQG